MKNAEEILAKIRQAAIELHEEYRDIPEEKLVSFFDLVCSLTEEQEDPMGDGDIPNCWP